MFRVANDKPSGAIKKYTYLKTVHTKNRFKKTNAWGLDAEVVDWLKNYQKAMGKEVDIILTDQKNKKYSIMLTKALEVGEYFEFKPHGKQLFIPIKEFN